MEKEKNIACYECGEKAVYVGLTSTLVGYHSPPGHDHDDNCKTLYYDCVNGHKLFVKGIRNRCSYPGCNWVGREHCEICGY